MSQKGHKMNQEEYININYTTWFDEVITEVAQEQSEDIDVYEIPGEVT